jgi:tetratricopeptide (TPR) repeat protein
MITRRGISFVVLIAALILGQSSLTVGQNPRNQQQAQAPAIGPKFSSEPEQTAFQAVQNEANPATRITLADTFLTTYPNSELAFYVHRFRMEAFTRSGNAKEAIAAAETALDLETKFLEKLTAQADADANTRNRPRNAPPPIDKNSAAFKAFADQTQKSKLYYYQNIMNSYQQLNDAPKTLEFGEKALGMDPENLLTLLTVSAVMAERPPASELDRAQHFKRAEELGKKAATKVNELVTSPAAAQMAEAQKAGLLSNVHQTLGTIYLAEKKYGDAQKEFLAAITAKKDDPVSYFRLGLAYAQDQPEKLDPALDAMAKSVYLKGVTQAQAMDLLKKLYEAKKKSLDGLEAFVQESGQKIGQ